MKTKKDNVDERDAIPEDQIEDVHMAIKMEVTWLVEQLEEPIKYGRLSQALDVGAGDGTFQQELTEQGLTGVSAVDPSPRGQYVREGTIEDVDHRDFDLLIYNHVLEHVPNYDYQIELARERLRENGYLFIAVPDYMADDQSWVLCESHINLFAKNTLKKLVRRYDFQVEVCQNFELREGRKEIWLIAQKE